MNVRLVTSDLLFGSKVEAMIRQAGAVPVGADAEDFALTVLDLTEADTDAAAAVQWAAKGGAPVLAYYSHVDDGVRKTAIAAGVDKIVPRSRMMRQGVTLIAELART